MQPFTHNGVVYQPLPNGKVKAVAYANPLAGATPVGGIDPTLAPKVTQAQNEATASQYDPAKAAADARIAELQAQIDAWWADNKK